jgi:hypothetical protein
MTHLSWRLTVVIDEKGVLWIQLKVWSDEEWLDVLPHSLRLTPK